MGDDLWMKIGSVLLMGMMAVYLFPRAKHMLKNSPKGSSQDWKGVVFLAVMVVLFIAFLTMLV